MSQQKKPLLDKLKVQREKLDARIQAEAHKQKQVEYKANKRMCLLIGEYYLIQMKKEDKFNELVQQMSEFLTNDNDRKLFGLPLRKPIKNEKNSLNEGN